MTITYNLDIPDAPNNPSNDQPKMKTNTNAINAWTAVDHVEFGSSPAGTHLQTTFSSKNTPAAQTDPQSVLYTANGVASTVAQLYFRNQNATFPISAVRAFGSFVHLASPSVPVFLTQYNVDTGTVTHPSTNTYVIPLVTNAVNTDNVMVLLTQSGLGANITYSFTGGVLTLVTTATVASAPTINFLVMQI